MADAIVVLGGLNYDFVLQADRLPRPGETMEGRRFYTSGGGKGANQAVAAARLAGPPTPVRMAREHGVRVILDPAPVQPELLAGFHALADILTPNQGKAEALTRVADGGPPSRRRCRDAMPSSG